MRAIGHLWSFAQPKIPGQKTTACLRKIQISSAPGSHHSLVICIEISIFCQVENPDPNFFPVGFLPKMDRAAAQKVIRGALHFLSQCLTIFGPAVVHFLIRPWTDFWTGPGPFLRPCPRQIGIDPPARRPPGENVPAAKKIRPWNPTLSAEG